MRILRSHKIRASSPSLRHGGAVAPADICFVLEGTYPYVKGGVASWTHDFIQQHSERTFHIVALMAPEAKLTLAYELPKNVTGLTTLELQELPRGRRSSRHDAALYKMLEPLIDKFMERAGVWDLEMLLKVIESAGPDLGGRVLLESRAAWQCIQSLYSKRFAGGSFLDFFWSWRSLFGGLFSVLLPPPPPARIYHALCTGYAGLYATRASLRSGAPLILTEHGLYTNERRVELGMATWFHDLDSFDMGIRSLHSELRTMWQKTFASYSRIAYQASSAITSLFDENRRIQTLEGADPDKQLVIPNGIDVTQFAGVQRATGTPLTVALIGRVVPIKGIKTFLQACKLVHDVLPDTRFLIMGPDDEDADYARECHHMTAQLGLSSAVTFTGPVRVKEYLSQIDVVALTSISEAQPLVILEAGAARIPCVATDVGACRELILGTPHENPQFGPGGAIARVSDATEIAHHLEALLRDPERRRRYGDQLYARVSVHYSSAKQHASYRELYTRLLPAEPVSAEAGLAVA